MKKEKCINLLYLAATLLLCWAPVASARGYCTETTNMLVNTSGGQAPGYACANCPACTGSTQQLKCIQQTNTIGEA